MERSEWMPRRTRTSYSWCDRAVDLVVCLLVLAALAAILRSTQSTQDWVSPMLQAFAAFSLLFRRTAPMWIMGLMLVAAAPLVVEGVFPGTMPEVDQEGVWVPLAAPFACYSVMAYGTDLARAWALTGVLTFVATRPWLPEVDIIAPGLLLTAVPALAGMYVRSQRRLADVLRDRAERAEREQHLLTEQARYEERAKLAVEMHDIVTHRVSLMVLHAGALELTTREDSTRAAAGELRSAGHQALEELREFLGVLRTPPAETDGDEEESGDRPKDDGEQASGEASGPDLARLVQESAAAGMRIEFSLTGSPDVVSPVIGRTAYRVVQEALSNAIKHAPGAPVDVCARYDAEELHLTVRNAAPERGPAVELSRSGSGMGLLGLRQRVELVGGELSTGPEQEGGFTVEARLPVFVPASANSLHL
ncbi:sensor histidine kinase [Streptomyces sp. NPDC017890]|uniref:sensor histidine kinase n=1 Tax=Streptomyces sp. NPDC017890 TaxID=3365015 RepID=UPI0037B16E49